MIFVVPINFLSSFELCLTLRPSKCFTLLPFIYKATQCVPIDFYSSRFIIYAPSLLQINYFLDKHHWLSIHFGNFFISKLVKEWGGIKNSDFLLWLLCQLSLFLYLLYFLILIFHYSFTYFLINQDLIYLIKYWEIHLFLLWHLILVFLQTTLISKLDSSKDLTIFLIPPTSSFEIIRDTIMQILKSVNIFAFIWK